MKVIASPLFQKKFKKFRKNEQEKIESEIKKLLKDPSLGEAQKQDLQGILVYKFKVKKQQLLLSCKVSKEALFLIAVGSHENYYRDLKNYLK